MNNSTKKITTLTKRVNNLSRRLQQTAPVAVNRISGSNNQRNVRSLSLKQTERIGTVVASGAPGFALASYNINPGTMFPWLGQHARLYDKYRFRSLKFTFKTAVPTNTPGNVGIGVDYDVLDSEPTDAIEFSQLASWSAQSVWKNFSTSVDVKKPLWDYLYNRSYLIGGADLKTYDIGKFLVYTEGLTLNAGDIVGYLEATYDVELVDKSPSNDNGILTASLTSAARSMNWTTSADGTSSGTQVSVAAGSYACLNTRAQSYLVNNLSLQPGQVLGTSSYSSASSAFIPNKSIYLDRGIYAVTYQVDNMQTGMDYELYSQTVTSPTSVTLIGTADSSGMISAIVYVTDACRLAVLAHNSSQSSISMTRTTKVSSFIIRKL